VVNPTGTANEAVPPPVSRADSRLGRLDVYDLNDIAYYQIATLCFYYILSSRFGTVGIEGANPDPVESSIATGHPSLSLSGRQQPQLSREPYSPVAERRQGARRTVRIYHCGNFVDQKFQSTSRQNTKFRNSQP
jgi:hypothetical protein